MHISRLLNHLRDNDCEYYPMPDWHRASTLEIVNKKHPDRKAWLNTNYEVIWGTNVIGICTKLVIPIPDRPDDDD
jgi:hypothetical protein